MNAKFDSDTAASDTHQTEGADGATLQLATFLPYRLSVLSNRVSNAIARAYSERFELTIPQWRAIAVAAERRTTTARDIAQVTAMDKVAVSRAVVALVERGLLSRTASENDGRVQILALTPEGWEIYGQIVPIASAYEEALLTAFSPSELTMLDALVDRLTTAAAAL